MAKLGRELREGTFDSRGAADQDMIGAGHSCDGQDFAGERPEAALHAVAHDGVADLPGDRDSEAHGRIIVAAPAHEQKKAGF
jgi:hypothetical protein